MNFFLDQFQSANNLQLSSLESDSLTKTLILDLSQGLGREVSTLGTQMKAAFGAFWKEVLCEGQLMEGKIDPGNPAVLIISATTLQSLEFLRGIRPWTRECPAAKLFSKHMKVDDQQEDESIDETGDCNNGSWSLDTGINSLGLCSQDRRPSRRSSFPVGSSCILSSNQ